MSTTHVICAQLEVESCLAELYVNGFPVARIAMGGRSPATIPVAQYLIPGTNEIEILVEPAARPSAARTARRTLSRPGARVTGRLLRFASGVAPEVANGELLIDVSFREETGAAAPFPRACTGAADLGPMFGRWAWQDAPPLQLDEWLVHEARAVLEAFGDALRSGSVASCESLLEHVQTDAMRAYPAVPPDLVRSTTAKLVAYHHGCKDPVFPLVRERHDFRLVAGGRLLQCIDVDGKPSLRLRDPESGAELPFSMFLARLGGEGRLRIVR
jgi:hypothetical protein